MFLSHLRGAMVVSKCQAMNKKKKVENHACLVGHYRHYRLYRCISRTTTRRGINKIPKCFSCPGDCKELSKKIKRSTYDSNQARTKPWPTRPPTSDNNSPITERIRTNETQNVSLTLATVEDCRRKQTVGTRAGPYGSGLHVRTECKLTSRPRIQKETKQEDTKILATIQNFRRRQERYRPKQTQPTLQGPSSTTMWVWLSL